MFENKKIKIKQKWNVKEIYFDPDSSPEAWEHYKRYYIKNGKFILGNYNVKELNFYNYYKELGDKTGLFKNNEWKNYINSPFSNNIRYNRLFALSNSTKIECENSKEYCGASSRLGGECDFNFNDKKQTLFKAIICDDKAAEKKLEKCSENHHTLINFSLMQGMGNMQSVKGSNKYDRLDVFVYQLSLYFCGLSNNIVSRASNENLGILVSYLNSFKDIYEYMEKHYFLKSKPFVDKIIEQGQLPISTKEDAIRYMDLAQEFWDKKEQYFRKKDKFIEKEDCFPCPFSEKDYLAVGEYFSDGGETYTLEELKIKIMNDTGIIIEKEILELIDKCVVSGFIYETSEGVFTR